MTSTLAPPPSDAAPPSSHNEAYVQLIARVVSAGILDRSYGFYAPLILAAVTGYVLAGWAVFQTENYLLLTLACLAFTFFTVQLAGLMHDSGHRAVFRSVRNNELLGLLASASIGMVFPNWTSRHNLHHSQPNREGVDPDFEIPFIALTPASYAGKDAVQRFAARWQAFYYFPLGSLVGFSNRLGSITFFLHNRTRGNLLRFLLYAPAMVILFAGPFYFFSLEKALFVFFLVHFSSGIYLASCFAPNHKGMTTVARDSDISFLEQQIVTSRDVSGGFITDTVLVGLNYQIEHHLFPSCPRNKLKLLKPLVKQVCSEQDLLFTEQSLLSTNSFLLRHLYNVTRRNPATV